MEKMKIKTVQIEKINTSNLKKMKFDKSILKRIEFNILLNIKNKDE